MIESSIERLEYLCKVIPSLLSWADEQSFSLKPHPEKWSKKEILRNHKTNSLTEYAT